MQGLVVMIALLAARLVPCTRLESAPTMLACGSARRLTRAVASVRVR
jgi:hypothetical protein